MYRRTSYIIYIYIDACITINVTLFRRCRVAQLIVNGAIVELSRPCVAVVDTGQCRGLNPSHTSSTASESFGFTLDPTLTVGVGSHSLL